VKTKVMDLANLPLLTPVLVTVDGIDVFVYRRPVQAAGSESEILAIGNECPHQGGNLCDGWIDGDIVTCPLHGWEFDLRSGVCMTIPGERVPAYRPTVEDGAVYLEPAD
jgi:nitrite reductase/ring-hydroxylating ferredoxin subunit